MKNLHLLSTDKASRLRYFNDKLELMYLIPKKSDITFHNIYITNDEEIKEGDWCIMTNDFGDIYLVRIISLKCIGGNEIRVLLSLNIQENTTLKDNCKKIILTTDEELINDGVQAISEDFLEWFVKNPSCESVVIEECNLLDISRTYLGIGKYKIIIPQEELKTSEEWQKQFPNTKVLDSDGWDRKNYQYSWFEEKITLAEYTTRLHKSSVQGLIPQEPKQETTLEEAACLNLGYDFQTWLTIHSKDKSTQIYTEVVNWCKGAKWQQERSYSDIKLFAEELKDKIDSFEYFVNQQSYILDYINIWYEKYKK
jgi:hypothetical protein